MYFKLLLISASALALGLSGAASAGNKLVVDQIGSDNFNDSGQSGSNLETLMRVRGRDQLLVTGVYAHIGCTATVVEAFQRDIEAFIAADAVADFSRADHDQALHWIARTSGVPMTTDQLLEVL